MSRRGNGPHHYFWGVWAGGLVSIGVDISIPCSVDTSIFRSGNSVGLVLGLVGCCSGWVRCSCLDLVFWLLC